MPDIDPMLEDSRSEVRDDTVDMQQFPMSAPDGQDGTQVHADSHPDQQQHQQQQGQLEEPESTTTQQEEVRASVTNTEELQLAAQLSQDLAGQGMPTILDPNEDPNLRDVITQPESHESHESQEVQQLEQQHDQLQPSQAQVPEHHNHIREEHSQPLAHDDQSIDSHHASITPDEPVLQLHDQQQHQQQRQHQQQQYIPDEHQQGHQQIPLPLPQQAQPQPQQQQHPPHLHPQGSMEQFAQHAQHYAAQAASAVSGLPGVSGIPGVPGVPDGIPPRKRSKVSRACDECRRKKVKCDAVSENGEEPCSNCRRSAIRCLFSRIPQKRGPSKGYIKELADRINHIEGKLASEGGNVDSLTELLNGARRESAELFGQSGPPDENSRKRPYSSISGADFSTPASSRQATWSSEPRPIQPYQTPTATFRGPYSANGLAPQPLAKPDSSTPSRSAPGIDTVPPDHNHNGPPRELNEDAFNGYRDVVHPCFPVLAATKARVEAQLMQCPPLLRDAFVEAFYCTMQSFVSVPGLYTTGDIGSATRIIAEWESDSTPRTPVMNLVHLQTLILAAIATDNYGPSSLKGEHGGPSKASVLGRAVGLAYSMRLHVSALEGSADARTDADSDENIAIRAWWTLIMLDRWNAIGTSSPLFIPNDSVVLLPSLNAILGENVYHLARLSNILGHFAPVALAPPKVLSPESGAAPILSSFLNLSIELFREVLPQTITPSSHPILHMVYWHTRLLAYLFQTNAKSTDILWPCEEVVGLLLTNTQLLSPLNHHFFCLAALSLIELSRVEKTRDEATSLLRQLLDSNLAPSTWDAVIRDRISADTRPSTAQAAASQSLQRLADLATATEIDSIKPEKNAETVSLRTSDNYSDLGFDPRLLTRTGYLNVLADGLSSATP
ncbi:Glucose-responsive transcription factor [Parahypoxylon ruwenzoriense]